MKRPAKKRFRVFLILIALLVLASFFVYRQLFGAKVHLIGKNYTYIYIQRGSDFEDVMEIVAAADLVDNLKTFRWLAEEMKLNEDVHPGRYRINNGMNMRQIINLIRYQKEEKVKLT